MGPRRHQGVSMRKTCPGVAGERNIMRGIFTRQGKWSPDRTRSRNGPGPPASHLTGAVANDPEVTSDGIAEPITACTKDVGCGAAGSDQHEVPCDEYQNQIEPDPIECHPSQPTPHSLRLELIVSALAIRAGREPDQASPRSAGTGGRKPENHHPSYQRTRRLLIARADR